MPRIRRNPGQHGPNPEPMNSAMIEALVAKSPANAIANLETSRNATQL